MIPPIFQSPAIIQTITKVIKEAVIRQVKVFAIDLFFCSSIYLRLCKGANYSFLKISGWGPPVYQSIISTVCKMGIFVPFEI